MATIRPLIPDDIAAALRLWQGTTPVRSREVETDDGLKRMVVRNPGVCHVALDGGEIVGIAICGHDGRRGYLHHLGVLAAHRRCGIGHALVEACLAALHAEGIYRIHVQMKTKNADGLKFWRSLGCKERRDTALISLMLKSDEREGRDDS